MGEENTFAGVGTTCFFCKREDIGTDREKWHEAKLDSFKVRDAIEVPELDMEKIMGEAPPKWPKGFSATLTFSLEPRNQNESHPFSPQYKEGSERQSLLSSEAPEAPDKERTSTLDSYSKEIQLTIRYCMTTNLRQQWNEACLQCGIESISAQKAAKIMAVLMIFGNNEAMVMNRHFTADCEYIQKRFRINGGEVPDATFAEYLKEYVADLQEADRQGFIPQWAEKLFMEDYEIKLYR